MPAMSASRIWTGRVLSGLAVAFLLFDAAGKLARQAMAVEGTAAMGFPESTVVPIGILLLIGVVLHVIPRTSLLGAVYLTGYLGGAIAAHVRIGNPLATHTLFPVYIAVLIWGGLALRRPSVAAALSGAEGPR